MKSRRMYVVVRFALQEGLKGGAGVRTAGVVRTGCGDEHLPAALSADVDVERIVLLYANTPTVQCLDERPGA